jgi:predicted aspartyl protease
MCIDSGAGINAVSRNFAEKMASGRVIRLSKKRMISVVTGSKGQVDTIVPGTLTIGNYSTKLFWVIVDNLPIDALLGYPVMRRLGVSIDPSNNSISFENIATVRANKISLVYERTDILTCRSITVE